MHLELAYGQSFCIRDGTAEVGLKQEPLSNNSTTPGHCSKSPLRLHDWGIAMRNTKRLAENTGQSGTLAKRTFPGIARPTSRAIMDAEMPPVEAEDVI